MYIDDNKDILKVQDDLEQNFNYYTSHEVAQILNFSHSYILNLAKKRRLPSILVSGVRLFRKDTIDRLNNMRDISKWDISSLIGRKK